MKKIIVSAILAGALSSTAFASDTTALTRSTVKLIKAYHTMETKVDQIKDQSLKNDSIIGSNSQRIESLGNQVSKFKSEMTSNKTSINVNNNNINQLQRKMAETEATSNAAAKTARETQQMLLNANGLKDQANKLANRADAKSKNLEQRLIVLETADGSKLAANNKSRIDGLEKRVSDLEAAFKLHKDLSDKKAEEIMSMLNSYKLNTDANFRVMRAKLDRTNPVYVIDRAEAKEGCASGNCGEVPEADAVINNFLSE